MFQNSFDMSHIEIHDCMVHNKVFQKKNNGLVKRPWWHQGLNFGGWTHVTVYASVDLVTFVQVCGIVHLCALSSPNFVAHAPTHAPRHTEW